MVELKKDVPAEGILNYLYKNTDLQVTYNFNMIAIHNRTTNNDDIAAPIRCIY